MQHLTNGVISVDSHSGEDQKSRGNKLRICYEKKLKPTKFPLGPLCLLKRVMHLAFFGIQKKGSKLQVWTAFEVVRVNTSRLFES